MTTVTEELVLPDGTEADGWTVTIQLAGENGNPVEGFDTVADTTVVGRLSPAITDGAWSADLVPNDNITPTGTVWKRTVVGGGGVGSGARSWTDYFTVPVGGGPVVLADRLTQPPGALPPTPGVSQAILDDALADYVRAAAHGSTVGNSQLDEDGDLVVDIETDWGIDPSTGPYFAPGEVVAGEEAIMRVDRDGIVSWVLVSDLTTEAPATVDSVNGRTGVVVGLAEQADLADEITERSDADAELDGRVTELEEVRKRAYKTAATSRATDVLAADPDLTVDLPANSRWAIRGMLFVTSDSPGSETPDIEVGVAAPAGATGRWHVQGPTLASTTYTSQSSFAAVDLATTLARGVDNASFGAFPINAFVHIDATPGAFAVRWAQDVADAVGISVLDGSWIVAERLDA